MREVRARPLVQLGYNGAGKALVFVPEYVRRRDPDAGARHGRRRRVAADLAQLKLPERQLQNDLSLPRGILVH